MKEKANRYWPLIIWKQRYVYQDYNFSAVQKSYIYSLMISDGYTGLSSTKWDDVCFWLDESPNKISTLM